MELLPKLLMVTEFLAIFAITSIISNGLYSTATVLFAVMILFAYFFRRKLSKKQIIFPDWNFIRSYGIFFFCIILASLFIGYKDSIGKAFDFTYWSVVPFVLFYVGSQRFLHEKTIIAAIVSGVWALCSYALYQYFIFPEGTRIESYLSHPNYLCEMLELSLPFLLFSCLKYWKDWKLRIIIGITTLICCGVIALTACRGGILGLGIGGIIYFFIQTFYVKKINGKKFTIGIGAMLLAALCIGGFFCYNFNDTKVSTVRSYDGERILLWKSSYEMWKDHKMLGVGLRHWENEYVSHYISPMAKEPNLQYPHNTFIYFFSSTGIIGGIGFLFFTVGVFIYLCQKLKQNPQNMFLNALLWAFLAIMLHGLVNAAILSKFVMRLYSTYLGIGLGSVVYYQQLFKDGGSNEKD